MKYFALLTSISIALYGRVIFTTAFTVRDFPSKQCRSSMRLKPLGSDVGEHVRERRDVLQVLIGGTIGASTMALPTCFDGDANAADAESGSSVGEASTDLTSQMFNADGSLKQEMEMEAKFRSVAYVWDPSQTLIEGVDGESKAKGSSIQLSYKLPEKWGTSPGKDLYVDKSEGVNEKACKQINVYQAGGNASSDRLAKATKIGVGKALDVTDELKEVNKADLIGGRTVNKDGQRYYEFDLALAPSTCGDSQENLGLGFCPYESIYLFSATVLDEKLYVFALQCDKGEWKRANSDLRRVRSSFEVVQA